jgi:hypothetical protein
LLQVRICEPHIVGEVGEAKFQAVTDAPLAILPHHGRLQDAQAVTLQLALEYDQANTPLLQVRVSLTQLEPHATDDVEYALMDDQ